MHYVSIFCVVLHIASVFVRTISLIIHTMYQIQHMVKIVVGHPWPKIEPCTWLQPMGEIVRKLGKGNPKPHVDDDLKYVSHQRRGLENKTAPELCMIAILLLVLWVFQRLRLWVGCLKLARGLFFAFSLVDEPRELRQAPKTGSLQWNVLQDNGTGCSR